MDQLQELLAIIHQDGGQRTNFVGIEQSVKDAHEKLATFWARAAEPTDPEQYKGNRPADADAVHRPAHYTAHPSGVECIEITRHMPFPAGNALKYVWRAGQKGDLLEDLKKALKYTTWEIENNISEYNTSTGIDYSELPAAAKFKNWMANNKSTKRDELILALIEGRLRTVQIVLEAVIEE